MVTYNYIDFPLTHKWRKLIYSVSYLNKFPVEEGFQESLIIEWQTSQKIQDLTYRENYFKKVLYQKLYLIGRDAYQRKKSTLLKQTDGSFEEVDLLENIISVRPFDLIFFDELLCHVYLVLKEIDSVASEMFVYKTRAQLRWKEIRALADFRELAHSNFYQRVRLIKSVVKREVMIG